MTLQKFLFISAAGHGASTTERDLSSRAVTKDPKHMKEVQKITRNNRLLILALSHQIRKITSEIGKESYLPIAMVQGIKGIENSRSHIREKMYILGGIM